MSEKYLRSFEEVIDEGLIYPGSPMDDKYNSCRRLQAIVEVAARIPTDDYLKLDGLCDSFVWFIPDPRVRGMVYPFPANYYLGEGLTDQSRVLYLSPQLEHVKWDMIVAVVAHELAHIFLGHDLFFRSSDLYTKQEDDAFQCMVRWGFIIEAKKLERVNKWRDSMLNNIIRRLNENSE